MKISTLIKKLQSALDEHGDLKVHFVCQVWRTSSLPSSAMGGGGGGQTTERYIAVTNLQLSEKYPNQLEIEISKWHQPPVPFRSLFP